MNELPVPLYTAEQTRLLDKTAINEARGEVCIFSVDAALASCSFNNGTMWCG